MKHELHERLVFALIFRLVESRKIRCLVIEKFVVNSAGCVCVYLDGLESVVCMIETFHAQQIVKSILCGVSYLSLHDSMT